MRGLAKSAALARIPVGVDAHQPAARVPLAVDVPVPRLADELGLGRPVRQDDRHAARLRLHAGEAEPLAAEVLSSTSNEL
jgi:hypothetical protein